jgi:trehalose 6-phosphate phosphatase
MVPEVLAAIEARPPRARLVVLSDFDGTLTSFDVDPAAPRLSAETKRVLETLASREDVTVGLVSGRRVDDLEKRTQLPPHVYLAGLHGMEIRHGEVAWHHPDLVDSREVVDQVADAIMNAVGSVSGVKLEHKGVAVTVHVRGVDAEHRSAVLRAALDAARPWIESGALRSLDASEAVELLPNIAWTKGDAVRWIVEDIEAQAQQPAWCVFFGDDLTDEEAFRVIESGLTVVVGRRPSLARLRLNSPADVATVLRTMADRLRDTKLVVVANRQPYVHEKSVTSRSGLKRWMLGQGDKVRINWKQPASGLVTALDPVMQACGGTWVAHGNGTGDLEASDPSGRLAVPPDKPKNSLRRVWLKQHEEAGY